MFRRDLISEEERVFICYSFKVNGGLTPVTAVTRRGKCVHLDVCEAGSCGFR